MYGCVLLVCIFADVYGSVCYNFSDKPQLRSDLCAIFDGLWTVIAFSLIGVNYLV